MKTKETEEFVQIPQHVAVILDGNGRWAAKRKMPRNYGHSQGSKNVETICKAAYEMGIQYLTCYAFSTENWARPKEEIAELMRLLQNFLKDAVKQSTKNNMRVKVIGDVSKLPEEMQKSIVLMEESSKNNSGLKLQIALNYGGRDELVRAFGRMAQDLGEHKMDIADIDEAYIGKYLDTAGIPDPDLLIRTSGEQRLSNYLLWQLAYTELYFTEVLWPDFTKENLKDAVAYFNRKERRFGGLK